MNVLVFNMDGVDREFWCYSQEITGSDGEVHQLDRNICGQGCHGTGKTGNLKVHLSRQGKHREFAKKY